MKVPDHQSGHVVLSLLDGASPQVKVISPGLERKKRISTAKIKFWSIASKLEGTWWIPRCVFCGNEPKNEF